MRPLLALLLPALALAAGEVRVFILAGQSNMEGQAVVDLTGKNYNDGKGTLVDFLGKADGARFRDTLRNPDGSWRTRDDVFVRYERERAPTLKGPLGTGYSVYGSHHFGPELMCGHALGDAHEEPVLLIKCAWGGKSLIKDYRPPSAGGETGPYYLKMLSQVREALRTMEEDFPALRGRTPRLSGLVWYQGWNDGIDPKKAVPEYASNLAHLIRDVRRELGTPDLPVVVGELTGPWRDAPPEWERLRAAQREVTLAPEFAASTAFAPTRDFVRRAEDSPNPGHGHHEFGNAETYLLIGESLGRQMALLSSPLRILSPAEMQVVQRRADGRARLDLRGRMRGLDASGATLEWRPSVAGAKEARWVPLRIEAKGEDFVSTIEFPAGGWYGLEVRATSGARVLASAKVGRFGAGEIFVVAGQSNSANHGEERMTARSPLVVNFDGTVWRACADPQPGASGRGGSFVPALGDLLAERLKVPVAFVTTGIGATSVREWLPAGTKFAAPPTIESRVEKLPSGEWASKGAAYAMLVGRMRPLGPNGFRAVLWHQGESDANQRDATRTLPGRLYAEHLSLLIGSSRKEVGWDAPWMVAQVSYHTPDDMGSEDIRAAQASLWGKDRVLRGPDSDALRGALRERGGKGVHFSGDGQRTLARAWADLLIPWIEGR